MTATPALADPDPGAIPDHAPLDLADDRFENGDCLAFAAGLRLALLDAGVPCRILLAYRDVIDADGDPIGTSLSHAAVSANGLEIDHLGPGAVERWEAAWQEVPDEDGETSEFRWIDVDHDALPRIGHRWGSPLDQALAAKVKDAIARDPALLGRWLDISLNTR